MADFHLQQFDSMDCGPTCLAMVCRYHGKNVPVQQLREQTQIGKEGVNLLGISEAAEKTGFKTLGAKLSLDQLKNEVPLPCIIHWDQNHFAVLVKPTRKGASFVVADPGKDGLVTYTEAEFCEHWIGKNQIQEPFGIALLLEPTQVFYENSYDSNLNTFTKLGFERLWGYVKPHLPLFGQLMVSLVIASIISVLLPFLTQSIVDTGVNNRQIDFIYMVLVAQLALFAGRTAVEFVRGWILLHISTRINLSILTDFLMKLMRLPVSYFDSKKTGDILQRLNDHHHIESFLTGSSLSVIFSMFNLVVFSIVLLLFNVQIFTVFMAGTLLYGLWVFAFLKKQRELNNKGFDIASKEQSNTIQLVQGMQEIKLQGCEKQKRWEWERLQAQSFQLSIKGLILNQWQQAGALFINEGKNIFITFLAASSVINGNLTLGGMLAVQYIIGQLNSPVEQLIQFIQHWQQAKISIERLNEIHGVADEEPFGNELLQQLPLSFARAIVGGRSPQADYKSEVLPFEITNPDQQQFPTIKETEGVLDQVSISFKNLTFTYPGAGNSPVLKDINLAIPKGKVTAIVGMSGSGKTTLLKLLLKFYDAQKGDIKIGESSLMSISHKIWRQHCGVVMQESYIFSDTIAKNIAVGDERINQSQLRYALQVANIEEFIDTLPLGLQTKIGQEGVGLSMGQKQRILIARAVYRDPELILLDEATNSLDANNEKVILDNLNQFFKGRTVVVVAHRLSTVKNADQIVVLDRGEIAERGTHEDLINLRGDYYHLIKNQLELGN